MNKWASTSPAPYEGPIITGASFIDEFGLENSVTAKDVERMGARPKNLKCLCGQANLHFRGPKTVKGGAKTSPYFQTNPSSEHLPTCSVITRRANAVYIPSGAEYDPSKPLRIHLNLPEEKWSMANLGKPSFRMYNSDGSFVNTRYREWETASVKSIDELLNLMNKTNPVRLKNSLVIINNFAIPWADFCLSDKKMEPWKKLYEQGINGKNILRLFLSAPRPQSRDLFAESITNRVQLSSIVFSKDFVLNVFAKLSPDIQDLDRAVGHYAMLAFPSVGKSYTNRLKMADLTIEPVNPHYATRFDYDSMRQMAIEKCLAAKASNDSVRPS